MESTRCGLMLRSPVLPLASQGRLVDLDDRGGEGGGEEGAERNCSETSEYGTP